MGLYFSKGFLTWSYFSGGEELSKMPGLAFGRNFNYPLKILG